ncbi:MAG: hypothetical protein Q8O25_16080 [Sulfurisoma sp.]|nr:hypothetical protein [Sulfurisoma sp.]
MSEIVMRDAVRETVRCLTGAQYILEKTYPEGDAPAGVLPALIVAIAINRTAEIAADIGPELAAISEALREASPPDLEGIERELYGIASAVDSK